MKTEDRRGAAKVLLIQEENQASPKSPQGGRSAERTGEEPPAFNNLQPGTGNTGDTEDGPETTAALTGFKTEKSPNNKSDSGPSEAPGSQTQERLTDGPKSLSGSETEGKVSLELQENSETDDRRLVQQSLKVSKIPNLESNSRPEENRLNLGFNAGPSKEFRLDLESNPDLKGEKSPDVAVTEEEEEEVKKQSLR